jgi:hypothetical protein
LLQEKLDKAECVALTTDLWTSNGPTDSYMTITSHFIDDNGCLNDFVLDTQEFNASHSAENLHLYLTAQAYKWNVDKKTDVVVTDNASTITKAVELSDYESLGCAGHTINLCVKDITEKEEKIKDLLAKCRAIVGHFKRSSKATQKLKTCQNRLELKNHKLIQEVSN